MGVTSPATCDAPWKPFLIRCVQAILVLLPFAYLGMLLSTVVHEALGHGLATVALGGHFDAFSTELNGMGMTWSYFDTGESAWKEIVVLSSGVTVTLFLGMVFLVQGIQFRRTLPSLILLVLSLNFILDGSPYVFWNSVYPDGHGDIGRILSLIGAVWVRPVMIGAGAIIMFGGIGILIALIFHRLEGWIGSGGRLLGIQRIVVLSILGLIPSAMWLTFSWSQVIPDAGYMPSLVGSVSHILAVTLVYGISFRTAPDVPSIYAVVVTAILGCLSLGVTVTVIVLWLAPIAKA